MTAADPILGALGARIRTLREHRDLTQADLAETVGLSRTSITNLEAGRQGDVPATKLVALAKALGSSVSVLLGESPTPNIPLVQVTVTHDVLCDECGLVQSGIPDADDAHKVRRGHMQGHLR